MQDVSWNYRNIIKVIINPSHRAENIKTKRNTKRAVENKSTGQFSLNGYVKKQNK